MAHKRSEVPELEKMLQYGRKKFVRYDEGAKIYSMHELVESIMLNGVLVPVTVRPLEDGDYEMISGRRRLFAVKEIGLERIPAIIKNYDDAEAVLAMVDSNLQREEILPSEKAFAYTDVDDLILNTIGVVMGACIVFLIRRKQKKNSSL